MNRPAKPQAAPPPAAAKPFDWPALLAGNGQQALLQSSTAERPPEANFFAPLSRQGLLALDGPDGRTFLHGQSTADIQGLPSEQCIAAACCTPQGRVVANFLCAEGLDSQQLLLRMPQATIPVLSGFLARYIIFSKATLSDASERLGVIGVAAAEAVVERCIGTPPPAVGERRSTEHGLLLCTAPGRMEFWSTAAQLEALWPRLCEQLQPAAESAWELLALRDGLASVLPATTEEFLPQALDLQHHGAVSFTKGCYTGQEVVARLQHRGKGMLKTGLYLLAGSDGAAPEVGQAICAAEDIPCGKVLGSAAAGPEHWELLASINHRHCSGQLTLNGRPLQLLRRSFETTQQD